MQFVPRNDPSHWRDVNKLHAQSSRIYLAPLCSV